MPLFDKSDEQIAGEAADWKTRLGEGASEEVLADFRQWRDSDPRHAQAYARIDEIWGLAPGISIAPTAHPAANSLHRGRSRPYYALAASLAVAIVLVSVLMLAPRWLRGPEAGTPEMQLFATAVGEFRESGLPDGSRLILDSASRVEARYTKTGRSLTLVDGRARFRVARDGRPFTVRAGLVEVVATGTLFDVSMIGGRTSVSLLEGSVEVRTARNGRPPHRLEAGQKLTLQSAAGPLRQAVSRSDTLWPTRMLEFTDTPLAEAAALANRYSRIRLEVGGSRIGNLRVSGAYRAGDIAGLARSLAAAFDLRVETQGNGNLRLVERDSPAR